jgi:hypothetical protein
MTTRSAKNIKSIFGWFKLYALCNYLFYTVCEGHAVAQLVEALRYKPEGRGFESRWCHNPSGRTVALGLTQPLTEMSTRYISWGVKAAGA